MKDKLKKIIKPYIRHTVGSTPSLIWIKKEDGSWLANTFPENSVPRYKNSLGKKIEKIAQKTNEKGEQPLWEGYKNNNTGQATRNPNVVRTDAMIGNTYTYIVQEKKPEIIVEFGTAFGVSGMYFLAGIELNKKGQLLTFDPNSIWAKIARENLSQISDNFISTIGTFEDNINNVLSKDSFIDIAFIDAIHTKEFVIPQLEIVISKSKSGTIIILDDIDFSDNMKQCWKEVSLDDRFISSLQLNERVGILELK